MKNTPVWKKEKSSSAFSSLTKNITVDIAIIGGGITGITTAHLLAKEGKSVVVLEANEIGGPTTGFSTGNLYSMVDEELHRIQKNHGKDTAMAIAESRGAAVDLITRYIKEYKIDCDYQMVPWYLFSESEMNSKTVSDELQVAKELGLLAHEELNFPLPFKVTKAMRVDSQAQINPHLYIRSLAKKIDSKNCKIYENSKVEGFHEQDDRVILKTKSATVTADKIVMATHTPKGFNIIQASLGPYREYALAFKLPSGQPEYKGIFWGMVKNHHYSIRTYKKDKENYLLILGESHKVGQKENNEECLKNLEDYIKERMNVGELSYWWAAQHFKSADGIPYIGKSETASRIYYATGFSTDGLVYGTLSAMILSDELLGRENRWKKVYSPSRHNTLVAAKDFIKENANVAMQYIKDLSTPPETKDFMSLQNGEAKMVEANGQKCAAYREENGTLHVVSAYCPHMKCVVHWNSAEKTWDCPCHGSRFKVDGEVIEGPAVNGLDKII